MQVSVVVYRVFRASNEVISGKKLRTTTTETFQGDQYKNKTKFPATQLDFNVTHVTFLGSNKP